MRFAYKYRLYPNQAQVQFLEDQVHEACELYNAALEERRDAWKVCRKSINYYDQANQLKPVREEGLLRLANFSCCQEVLRRLDKTFQAFFARLRRREKPGFPRFRSFRRYDSITFPSYGDGCRLLNDGKLRIQGAGLVKVKLHRPVERKIKTVDVNHWVVCFSVERDSVALPESSEEIGMMSDWIALWRFRMAWRSTIPDTSTAGWHTSSAFSAGFPGESAAATVAARPPHLWPRRTVKSETSVPPFIMISATGWWNATG